MNWPLIVAGMIMIAMCVNHSISGERFILSPLLERPDIPPLMGSADTMRQVLRFSWHLTTVTMLGYAAVLLFFAGHPQGATGRSVLQMTIAVDVVSALLIAFISRARHFAWPMFLLVAAATWWGLVLHT